MKAWHFTGMTLRDGSPIPPIGEWLVFDGPVKMCKSGLHESRRILDALQYAPGSIAHRVECDQIVDEVADKLVCRMRKIVASVDVSDILCVFSRRVAQDVLSLWDAPEIVKNFLYSGDPRLAAEAAEAARAAAWAALAARAAYWAAEAARAAWAAAWAAAKAAEAARAAAKAKKLNEYNLLLEKMVLDAMGLED